MQPDQPLHQGEPHAEPPLRAVQRLLALLEEIERRTQQVRVHADAIVLHRDEHLAILAARAHGHLSAFVSVLGRVVQQVLHHLRQARLIGQHRERLTLGEVDGQRVAAGLHPLQRAVHRRAHHPAHIERLPVERNGGARDARYVEEIVDQARHLAGLARKHLAHPLLRGIRGRLER